MASSKLRPAVADRDTSDRPLPPTNLSTCTRARGSRPTFDSGVEAESRWIEGHDVSRRRRPLPPDRTIRPRLFTAVASFGRASGIPVARPLVRAALAGDCEPVRPSQDRRLSGLREETERVSDPGMPSFDRTLGLPSARSIPPRALRRGCDPVNVHEAVRPTIASSSRAPGQAPFDACPGVSPSTEPPPTRLLRDPDGPRSCRAPPCRFRGATGFQTGFSGLAAAYRFLQRMFDARARPRAVNPPSREAPASVRVGTGLRRPTSLPV